jgi:prepilin-type N-terminal cleavage/methylation domain-containing protein
MDSPNRCLRLGEGEYGTIVTVNARQRKWLRNKPGFTMIEMIVVVVVVGLLAGMGSSVWKKTTAKMRAQGDFDGMHKSLLLAKSDAMSKKHHSGILIDVANKKYLRFVDSSIATGVQDGQYTSGESILQNWTPLSSGFTFFSVSSSLSPLPSVRKCGTASSSPTTTQSGLYSIVFRPDGTSWSSLTLIAGVASIPGDTTRLFVIQSSGLVYKVK